MKNKRLRMKNDGNFAYGKYFQRFAKQIIIHFSFFILHS